MPDFQKDQIARCRQRLSEIDCEDYYDGVDADEPILKKQIITRRLALMLGAVHFGGPQTPEAFLPMLLEHVHDAEPSFLALESACRQIEREEKYMHAISEVLNVLKQHDRQWRDRLDALDGIERLSKNLQEAIRKAQEKHKLEEAERRVREAAFRAD